MSSDSSKFDRLSAQDATKTKAIDNLAPIALSHSAPMATWGPVSAILYSIVAFMSAQLIGFFAVSYGSTALGFDARKVTEGIFGQFLYVLLAEVLTVAAIVLFIRRRHARLGAAGIDKPRWEYVAYGVAGFIGYFVLYVIIIAVLVRLVPSLNMHQPQDIGFTHPVGTRDLVLTFISLAMLPPLAEEVLFRGFMFSGLRTRLGFAWAALLTSVFFAMGHLEFGNGHPLVWVAAVDTFTLSLVLCYIREKTGSIWAGVLIHTLKNTLAFSVLYIFKQ